MEQKPIHVDTKFAIDSLRKEPELSKQKKRKTVAELPIVLRAKTNLLPKEN